MQRENVYRMPNVIEIAESATLPSSRHVPVCLSYVPLKLPFSWEIRNTRFICPTSTRPKRHLDRFSRSIGLVNVSNIQTN